MSRYIQILILSFIPLCFSAPAFAQTVSVGAGSYTTTHPGADEAGRNGYPSTAPLVSGAAATKPIPTNDWWSSLLKNDIFGGGNDFAENLFNYPISMQTTSSGLVMSYIPFGVFDDQDPIVVGVSGLNVTKTTVSDFSDWTVTMNWDNKLQAISGIGMPFVYFTKNSEAAAAVTINLGSVAVSGEVITVTDARNGADFAIYAPVGSTWSQSGNTYTSSLNGQNYWSVAMLPQTQSNVTAIAEEYKKYAYVFPTNTTADWTYDESTSVMRTAFNVEVEVKEGTNSNVLMGLLPHQWDHLATDSPVPAEYTYESVRGDIRTLDGNAFVVENAFHGILPTLPYLANYSDGFDLSALADKITMMENDQLATWTDSYNEGQVMNRLIQTARIADEMGMIEARDKMIATVKERLEDWLTVEEGEVAFLFYYHADWTALLGYPGGHGQDTNINDHHFHWGYFIHAAAFLEQYEPGWAAEWGPMVDLLVRDAASPDRNDELFPFLRNFSPYAGHCWANGMAAFPQGNDQESTSESMQFNSSLIHWGEITGNKEIRDLGIYLYTTEQSAVEEYWFDIDERIFPENQYSLVSRVWGNSYDNGTFWTTDIEASYGIELYPIHGGSMYLGHNIAYAEKLWAEIEGNTGILRNDDNVNLWHDSMWKYLSFTDPQKAIDLYNSYPDRNLKFGVSDAQTYYWLHAMNAAGQVDATITADYPIAVAFQDEGAYTYTAHNYSNSEIDVTFSDGFVLTVPAHAMATNLDSDVSGEISASFLSAYPGGSVDLTVVASGEMPSKVEFYANGALLGEDLSEPFEWKADRLDAKVHGFYAKIFNEDKFGVTNIVSVVVGEQEPFNASNVIPGTIEPGYYDQYEGGDGQGITYSDMNGNNQGDFRMNEGVDVALSDAEGATVGWINGGEWIEYTVEVEASGLYEMSYRFASGNQSGGGPFQLQLDGSPVSEDIAVSATGDWDDWQTGAVSDLPLPKGTHVLRLTFENGEFNLGALTFTYSSELPFSQPVADAGANVVVILPETTTALDGAQSADPGGDQLFYEWEQVYGPSVISFSDATVVDPEISNLEEGVYKSVLTVNDGKYYSSDDVLIIVSSTGNSNPSVRITSPKNNASFRQGDEILIAATASDLEGDVVLVEFYDGEDFIGDDDTAPFEMIYTGAALGNHSLTAKATDEGGAEAISSLINFSVNESLLCSVESADAQEGVFSVGYEATFEAVGDNVVVSFELLDTDKTGVIAFLREESPFSEVQMDQVSGTLFTKTLTNRSVGENLRLACKFAFAGGLAVTKYIDYEIGSNCDGDDGEEEDTTAPSNFTASVGEITFSSIELLLNGTDDSGTVIYTVDYGSERNAYTGSSGEEKSIVITGLAAETNYSFSVKAADASGNEAANNPKVLDATTSSNTNSACSGISSEAQQGAFEVGYTYAFETNGTDVTMTFELLDNKDGVIAYLWRDSPFQETAMTNASGKLFTGTISGQTQGTTISYACKFAFAGGLAVTKYFQYEVGDDCITEVDISPPSNFTAAASSITSNSIELLLHADDDSGVVLFEVIYGQSTESLEGNAGVEHSMVFDGLEAGTSHDFLVSVSDVAGNTAANGPISITATTHTILGIADGLEMYPNPVTDYLTIDWKNYESVDLFTLSGKKVLSTTRKIIDMRSLDPGVYFAIVSGKASTIRMKLVKE